MRAIVGSMIRLRADDVPPKVVEILRRGLAFPNPAYVERVRQGRWVGATPEEICLLEGHRGRDLLVPRGAVGLLREAAARAGQDLSFDDRRVVRPTVPYSFSFVLRDYQERAVAALVRQVQGCVVAPCGAGKTVIGVGAIARIGQSALIVVHTNDLVEQWRATARDALGLDAGVLADGEARHAEVSVATVQTLVSMDPVALAVVGRQYGIVIVDEAHHTPAAMFRAVLAHMSARYRFGLTATPERPDGLTPLLDLCVGPVAHRIGHDQLVAAGHLVVPRVVPVFTHCAPQAETHTELVAALSEDAKRNRLIVDLAVREARAGHAVFVLSGRIEHCELLASLVRAEGVAAEALTSQVSRRRRPEVLERFRSGELPVVCATSLADEGLDVRRLSRLVLATPARAEGRTIQRLGRLMRPHAEKDTPVLYDLVDDPPMTQRQYLARRRAYEKVLGPSALAAPVTAQCLRRVA